MMKKNMVYRHKCNGQPVLAQVSAPRGGCKMRIRNSQLSSARSTIISKIEG